MALAPHYKPRSTNTLHYKKRLGRHRKHTKPFLNTYWPYLPLFGVAGLVIIFGGLHYLGISGVLIGGSGLVMTAVAMAL